jgi:hypothetical protein
LNELLTAIEELDYRHELIFSKALGLEMPDALFNDEIKFSMIFLF